MPEGPTILVELRGLEMTPGVLYSHACDPNFLSASGALFVAQLSSNPFYDRDPLDDIQLCSYNDSLHSFRITQMTRFAGGLSDLGAEGVAMNGGVFHWRYSGHPPGSYDSGHIGW